MQKPPKDSWTEKVKQRQGTSPRRSKRATKRNKSAKIHGKKLKEPKTLELRKMTRWKTVPRSSASAARFVIDRNKNHNNNNNNKKKT